MLSLDIYQQNLAGLLLVCGTLLATRNPNAKGESPSSETKDVKTRQYKTPHRGSQWAFYVVYALVMASDWLQGPHLYSLYRDEHGVPQHLIPTLFTTGLLSATLSATVTGSLADRSGRRLASLTFCAVYALSCVLTTIPSLPCLFAGRVLGGIGTSLLFSVFESWMVADFQARHLGSKGLDLRRTFGTMSTVNSAAAIGSGVVSEWVVEGTGTRTATFGVAVAALGLAALFIYTQWDENYGQSPTVDNSKPSENTLLRALANKRVLSLGLASTIFEGSMYLFIFSWGPALEGTLSPPPAEPLPHGTIFASLMAAMMASSLIITRLADAANHAKLLSALLFASAAIFYALAAAPRSEQATFWLFCAFEACVGMYWPCMGLLRGNAVDDAVRAQVYGILRIPLNAFVVVCLLMTGNGEGGGYASMFGVCAGLLLVAALGVAATNLGEKESE